MNEYPEIINLEIMSKCNLKCVYCKLQHQTSSAEDQFMTFDKFKKCIDKIQDFVIHANEFMFSSVEPLIHPALFDMMDYITEINPNMEFPIQTNGMFLNESIVKKMSVRNVPWISVSLDGVNESQLSFFKKGTKFDTVVSNIKMLRKHMPAECVIRSVFVSNTENIWSLLEYVEFCKQLGIDAIDINGLFCYDRSLLKYILYSSEGNTAVEQIYQHAKKLGEQIGIQVQIPLLKPEFIACEWNKTLCIDGDGYINPCVMLAQKIPLYYLDGYTDGNIVRFGNIFDADIIDIWNSDECVNFHNCLKEKKMQDVCRFCSEGYGVVCSNR